ncbi:hypothetical protein QC281_45765, partial [Streptomyces sp. DH17]|nr:hypothetical protein [Streptomyces sp. DH17]
IFTNGGQFKASNGGTVVGNNIAITSAGTASATDSKLTLGGKWTNSGAINVVNATLNLAGTFATAAIGTINRNGGTVNLTGTLNNAGKTLTMNAVTGSWNFLGTVNGGTVAFVDGNALLLSGDNWAGTFAGGVTLNGDITVSGNSSRLRVYG